MEKAYYKSPVGILEFVCENNQLVSLKIADEESNSFVETDFIKDIRVQLDEYFSGKRRSFEIKINPKGTVFQRLVWTELTKIPYGEIRNYSEIAKNIGREKAQRAVGSACNKNPIMLVIPCHRVVNKDGCVGGFAYGTSVKEMLLEQEFNSSIHLS